MQLKKWSLNLPTECAIVIGVSSGIGRAEKPDQDLLTLESVSKLSILLCNSLVMQGFHI